MGRRPGLVEAGRRPDGQAALPVLVDADRAAVAARWRSRPSARSVSRSTGGYAGLFDPAAGTIEVAYYADDFVVLHESAHAWFNGSLLADRWANEGFASYYGLEAAKALGIKATADPLTDDLKAARIPLNAWGAIGREDDKTEDYAYAATLVLARAIAERAGPTASGRSGPTRPAGSVPTSRRRRRRRRDGRGRRRDGARDRRRPARLARPARPARGAHRARSFDDLWRTWVARDTDLPLLDDRTAARADYDAVVAPAGDWQLPRAVRDAMRAWQFDQATGLLGAARGRPRRADPDRDAARLRPD